MRRHCKCRRAGKTNLHQLQDAIDTYMIQHADELLETGKSGKFKLSGAAEKEIGELYKLGDEGIRKTINELSQSSSVTLLSSKQKSALKGRGKTPNKDLNKSTNSSKLGEETGGVSKVNGKASEITFANDIIKARYAQLSTEIPKSLKSKFDDLVKSAANHEVNGELLTDLLLGSERSSITGLIKRFDLKQMKNYLMVC